MERAGSAETLGAISCNEHAGFAAQPLVVDTTRREHELFWRTS